MEGSCLFWKDFGIQDGIFGLQNGALDIQHRELRVLVDRSCLFGKVFGMQSGLLESTTSLAEPPRPFFKIYWGESRARVFGLDDDVDMDECSL